MQNKSETRILLRTIDRYGLGLVFFNYEHDKRFLYFLKYEGYELSRKLKKLLGVNSVYSNFEEGYKDWEINSITDYNKVLQFFNSSQEDYLRECQERKNKIHRQGE